MTAGRRAVAMPPRMLRALTGAPVPRRDGAPPAASASLDIAVVVPSLRAGGINGLLAPLLRHLERRGHTVSVWLADARREHPDEDPDALRSRYAEVFAGVQGPLQPQLKEWSGADVVVAAGWRCAPTVLRLPRAGARVSLVPDYEPDLFAAGSDREWAAWTYEQGMPALCAGGWLAQRLAERHGTQASAFTPGIDHDTYRSLPTHRRDDLVLFHAQPAPRRGLALGLLALQELHTRRPELEIGLFGTPHELITRFPHTHGGALEAPALAGAYSAAAAGVSLSFTAPSAISAEMLACGLPVVELSTEATRATFDEQVVELAAAHPAALADALERLLDDLMLRADRSRAGIDWVAARTWETAAEQVEGALRTALTTG